MAVGMTFVILTAGIDLSVGSTLALAGVSGGQPGAPRLARAAGRRRHPAGRLPAGAGQRPGDHQGQRDPLRRHPGNDEHLPGAAHLFTGAQPISGFSPGFRFLGAGKVLHVPVPIILFLLSVVAAAACLQRTRLGTIPVRHRRQPPGGQALGHPRRSVHDLGLRALRPDGGRRALVLTARLNAAESIAGTGYELDVIASVVIGGTSLAGGRGGVWGTLLGAS